MRFVILGDDRGGPAFASFRRQVDRTNRSIDQHNASLGRLSGTARITRTSLSGLQTAMVALAPAALPGIAAATAAVAGIGAAAVAGGAALGVFGVTAKTQFTKLSESFKQITKLQEKVLDARDLKAKQTALADLRREQTQFAAQFGPAAAGMSNLSAAWARWQSATSKPTLAFLGGGMNLLASALPKLRPLFDTGAVAANRFLAAIQGWVTGGGMDRAVTLLNDLARQVGPPVEQTMRNLAVAAANLAPLMAAFATGTVNAMARLSGAFAAWTGRAEVAGGFTRFIAFVNANGPALMSTLGAIAMAAVNIARGIAPLAPVTLAVANALARMIAVAPPQVITALAGAFIAWSVAMKGRDLVAGIGGLASGIGAFATRAAGAVTTLGRVRDGFFSSAAAASAFSGTAGTVGGNLRTVVNVIGSTAAALAASSWAWIKDTAAMVAHRAAMLASAVAARAMAVAQWLVNVAMNANPILLIVTALVALGTALYVAWTKSATFRDIVIGVWNAVWGVIRAVCGWITAAAMAVFNWIRANWPLLLGILTGPIGLAAVAIVKNWSTISYWASVAFQSIRNAVAWLVDKILWSFGLIVNGAAWAFGWVPGLGGKLRDAAKAFDNFRDRVNAAIAGVQSRTVTVGVTIGSQSGPGHRGAVAKGGLIREGTGPVADDVPLWASRGEYMVKAAAVSKYGVAMMDAINAGRYATGGLIPRAATPSLKQINAATVNPIMALAQQLANAMFGGASGIVNFAKRFLGVPYVWGGTTPAGWDCSGFTSYVYRHFGYGIPRTSQAQYGWVRRTGDRPGALVFFVGAGGGPPPGHVGISMGNGKMINAAGTQWGTIISGTGGNMGFGIPPGGFARGSWYVPRTAPAMVHRGEMILPAEFAETVRGELARPGRGDAAVERLLRQLIAVTAAQGSQFARELNGTARSATIRAGR